MKTKQLIFLVLALVLLGGLSYGLYQYFRKAPDLVKAKANMVLTDMELIKAYTTNEAKSDSLYLDKVIKVKGTVKSVEKDPEGFNTVYLGASDGENSVSCAMSKKHNAETEMLKVGDKAIFQGKCAGFMIDVSLTECGLQKE